jgi:hypothetical protein
MCSKFCFHCALQHHIRHTSPEKHSCKERIFGTSCLRYNTFLLNPCFRTFIFLNKCGCINCRVQADQSKQTALFWTSHLSGQVCDFLLAGRACHSDQGLWRMTMEHWWNDDTGNRSRPTENKPAEMPLRPTWAALDLLVLYDKSAFLSLRHGMWGDKLI